ncbi:hypothetical protein ROZALSC1DRAFT_29711 [Rozella allomycis CSF55]|uniref:Uncharacterized protein n=1 Tax=Rozella allomycis (strain CSF55) TaxID=988480 RepID=A0A075AWL6_ROZAC|nr:hypothetical protein O9G_004032 [Rozella allomycis CSF55]RKP18621.1 hypothetical protein ROZALSC1DRAFT_29711 [Rozella allomycis CSF55]|eukprot:EPZ34725.1 hypothetical protein O9G_004032 [Rozella allomycis CSF55]
MPMRPIDQIKSRTAFLFLHQSRWGMESILQNVSLSRDTKLDIMEKVKKGKPVIDKCYKKFNLFNFATPEEATRMAVPAGHWTPSDVRDSYFSWESLGIYSWYLRVIDKTDFPPYYELFKHEPIYGKLGLAPSQMNTFEKFFSQEHDTISDKNFLKALKVAEAWYWRCQSQRVYLLKQNKTTEEQAQLPKTLQTMMNECEKVIEAGTQRAFEEGYIAEPIENDFPVNGRSYKTINSEEVETLDKISLNRLNELSYIAGRELTDDNVYVRGVPSVWEAIEERIQYEEKSDQKS